VPAAEIRDRTAASVALRRWFASAVGDPEAEIADLRFPNEGASGDIILARALWRDEGGEHDRPIVCRVQAKTPLLFLNPDVMRDARIMSEVGRYGLPVPACYWQEADPTVLGTPFVVTEFVEGAIPGTVPSYHQAGWVTELSTTERSLLHQNALDALVTVHSVPWQEQLDFMFASGNSGGTGLDRHLAHMTRWHEWAAAGRKLGVIDDGLAYVLEERPRDQTLRLNWGDARPGNMIFGPDLSVRAVIDWEMATIGPRELDVGWWLMFEEWSTEVVGIPRLAGVPTRSETIARYEELTGHTLQDLDYYVLLAYITFALITVRFVALQVEHGTMSPDTTMHLGNPFTQMIARTLGLPVPEIAAEYAAVSATSTTRE
jgi:aminoglycoside phosphotransferase (APT) family kinase protein